MIARLVDFNPSDTLCFSKATVTSLPTANLEIRNSQQQRVAFKVI